MARYVRLAVLLAIVVSAMSRPGLAQAPSAAPNSPAPAAAAGPFYALVFFETAAGSHGKTVKVLRGYAAATSKADGNLAVLPLQEIGRPARFALVEVWRDKATADAHAAAMGAFRGDLLPVLTAPFDMRANGGLDVAESPAGAGSAAERAVYVLTHVDVFPAGKDQTIDMLKQLAAASRKEAGNLRFDVLQQDGRLNHLPLIEAWRDLPAQNAHALADHTRAFRGKLVSLQGALYDERLYRSLR